MLVCLLTASVSCARGFKKNAGSSSSSKIASSVNSESSSEESSETVSSEEASADAAGTGQTSKAQSKNSSLAPVNNDSGYNPITPVSGNHPSMAKIISKRCYNTLSAAEKALYDVIVNAVLNLTPRVPAPGFENIEALKAVIIAVTNDRPDLFWLSNSYGMETGSSGTFFIPQYSLSSAGEINAKNSEISVHLSEALSRINAGMTEYECELALHDWLVGRTSYDTSVSESTDASHPAFSAYGALVNKSAVCEGYSRAMQLMLNSIGIDCSLVIGVSGGGPHMWNIVKIDGEWYHLDATWNDPVTPVRTGHTYFNLTTADIQFDHSIDAANYNLPNCTATKNNYFVHDGLLVSSTSGIKDAVVSSLVRLAAIRGDTFSIRYNGSDFGAFLSDITKNFTPFVTESNRVSANKISKANSYSSNSQYKVVDINLIY